MSPKANILVTRPAGQAAALAGELTGKGYAVFEQPLLELHKLPGNDPINDAVLDNLTGYQHLIFISGNAARFGMEIILERGELPTAIRTYAIGAKTAGKLREYGLKAICPDFMTSEGLLGVEQLLQIEGHKILIVKGKGGRNTLRDGLAQRGALVDELACYQRNCPQLAPGALAQTISSCGIDLVLLSSGEGFCNMLKLLSPQETINLYEMPMIVPSRRVARMVRDAGFTVVHEASNATDDAMLEAVQYLQRQVGENK